MPEGPEIKRAADAIARVLEGHRVASMEVGLERLERFVPELEGATIESVQPRGKAMLIGFDCGRTLYSHNQLYGRWYARPSGKQPKTNRSLRVALWTDAGAAFLYSASEIEVLDTSRVRHHPYIAKLGPDALDRYATPKRIEARLWDDRFRRRRLAGLLLDQGFVAGIGNYLRSEILFVAGVREHQRPKDLNDEQRRKLARAIRRITVRAYDTKGVTLDAKTKTKAEKIGTGRKRKRHFVFGRDGQACYVCGTEIVRDEAAGRRVYFCGECQT